MPKPAAEFNLHLLYKGKVQIREYPVSHKYLIHDAENNRNWEQTPSATGLTGKMEKGAGLMMYAMSEAMKYMDRSMSNKSLKAAVEDENYTFKQLFKDARLAHRAKSDLGKRVGTAAHGYVEELLRALKKAEDTRSQFIVPLVPMALDLHADLSASLASMLSVYKFEKIEHAERYAEVVKKDVQNRGLIWQESMMIQNACEAARQFFATAAKQGAIKVWGVEQIVHSRKYFYSGKFDSVLEFVRPFTWRGYTIPVGLYVSDFKTSNPGTDYPMGIYPNFLAQIGLYDEALSEEFPELDAKITGHLLLGSSKTGAGFHPYVSLNRERNRAWARSLVPVMEYMHQGEQELRGLDLYGANK